MSDSAVNQSGAIDGVKWLVAVLFLASAVGGNYYFGELSVLYRAIGVVIAVMLALFVASTTEKGSRFINFAKESRTEVRKVVWPSRQEATQTTLIVLVATAFMAFLLYLLDMLIVWGVGSVTGIGG